MLVLHSVQVINTSRASRVSNVAFALLHDQFSSVIEAKPTLTVKGSGFSTLTVINFFNPEERESYGSGRGRVTKNSAEHRQ